MSKWIWFNCLSLILILFDDMSDLVYYFTIPFHDEKLKYLYLSFLILRAVLVILLSIVFFKHYKGEKKLLDIIALPLGMYSGSIKFY